MLFILVYIDYIHIHVDKIGQSPTNNIFYDQCFLFVIGPHTLG